MRASPRTMFTALASTSSSPFSTTFTTSAATWGFARFSLAMSRAVLTL